jgi:di/tricarboxylate transporter
MDLHGWIALATLAGAVTLFVSKWVPLEFTSLSIPVVLALTGTVSAAEAFSGFGNSAVIALGSIFVLGAGLQESGVATLMARLFERLAGRSERRILLLVTVAGAVLSAFMSNTATVAVFLPAVAVLARRTLIPSSRLLMPLAFASILGGTLTLIGTTPNLILGSDLERRTGTGLGMFEFARVGGPIVLVGIVYLMTVGRRLLPQRSAQDRIRDAMLPEDLAHSYGFEKNLVRLRVEAGSPAIGRTVEDLGLAREYDLDVVQVRRPGPLGTRYLIPRPDLALEAGDVLISDGGEEHARRPSEELGLSMRSAGPQTLQRTLGHGVTLAEVTVSPHSPVIGRTLTDLRFRNQFGLSVVSIWRQGEAITDSLGDRPLEVGDAFLVSGPPEQIGVLARSPDFVVLTDQAFVEDVRRAPLAVAILGLALLPPLLGWAPLMVSALAGALLMVATRCATVGGARASVDFRILFLVIGTMPLGIAVENHGVSDLVAGMLTGGGLGPMGLVLALFLISALVSNTTNNAAAAIILAPIAAQAAVACGLDVPRAFLAVAFGASCCFVIPFSHQCNLMVMSAGGYRTKDYFKVGLGLSVVMAVTTTLLLPWL